MYNKDAFALAIDIGGTKTAFGIMARDGDFIYLDKRPTPVQSSNSVMDFLVFHIREIIEKHENLQIEGVGIGTGGVVEPDTGTIIHATPLLLGWRGTPVTRIIEDNFKIRAVADNDGNMAALGEFFFGEGRGAQNLVFIAIGTGIGGGAILDGKVLRGSSGAAVNIGHLCVEKNGRFCNCGKRGCLEAYASGRAIENAYSSRVKESGKIEPDPRLKAEQIFQLMNNKDPVATDLIDETLDYLAIGITNLIEIFDPEAIILGGGVSESLAPMLEDIRSRVSSSAGLFEKEKIKASALGQTASLVGAASAILRSKL